MLVEETVAVTVEGSMAGFVEAPTEARTESRTESPAEARTESLAEGREGREGLLVAPLFALALTLTTTPRLFTKATKSSTLFGSGL